MVDPITGALATAISQGAVDTIRQRIRESENPAEKWQASIRMCAIDTQDTFEAYYEDPHNPSFDRLKKEIKDRGRSARGLANEGEREGYDKELTDLVDNLATDCAEYASAPIFNDREAEETFREQLDNVGGDILEKTDD